jgi:hypothetical protein
MKNDSKVQKVLEDSHLQEGGASQSLTFFYSKSKNFVFALGIIDYLQIFNFQRNI